MQPTTTSSKSTNTKKTMKSTNAKTKTAKSAKLAKRTRTDGSKYNGVKLPEDATQRRRMRNKLSAQVHRKRKADALNTAKEEVECCDNEINKLKEQLDNVSSHQIDSILGLHRTLFLTDNDQPHVFSISFCRRDQRCLHCKLSWMLYNFNLVLKLFNTSSRIVTRQQEQPRLKLTAQQSGQSPLILTWHHRQMTIQPLPASRNWQLSSSPFSIYYHLGLKVWKDFGQHCNLNSALGYSSAKSTIEMNVMYNKMNS